MTLTSQLLGEEERLLVARQAMQVEGAEPMREVELETGRLQMGTLKLVIPPLMSHLEVVSET